MNVTTATVRSILTRSSGYLRTVCSHSLQPYRGCSYGHALCGEGCYAKHNRWLTRGEAWGDFLEARVNAADAYREQVEREARWAARSRDRFSIFMSSSTDPFVPQERRLGITAAVLDAMTERPPQQLIVQTHSHTVTDATGRLVELARRCELRVHLSIESDRDTLPGLPPPASPVARRLAAAGHLRDAGLTVVVTVAPLLPIQRPEAFFAALAGVADAVVLDHFIGGDGSPDGARTAATGLPGAMAAVEPDSVELAYRDRMVVLARKAFPGRTGVGMDGFAGRWLPA